MGQYYRATIIAPDGRLMMMSSFSFRCGGKLTQHSIIGNEFVNAALSMIYRSPKKVAWIGDCALEDYRERSDVYTRAMSFTKFRKIYNKVWGDKAVDLTPEMFSMRDLRILTNDVKRRYLVNHDKRCHIDLAAYIRDSTAYEGERDEYCLNPMPLLTACGNGREGGDYFKDWPGYGDVGSWAFDTLEYTDITPGYPAEEYYFNDMGAAA